MFRNTVEKLRDMFRNILLKIKRYVSKHTVEKLRDMFRNILLKN